ncbi:MAG TPA: hypothetical protein PJ992_04120 [Arachnia sp.]|jgi:hypothetical protein|nr:hypothetical protein [Arachnia sp.]HMR12947.1 hypothetical protein [Arachnia sp.]
MDPPRDDPFVHRFDYADFGRGLLCGFATLLAANLVIDLLFSPPSYRLTTVGYATIVGSLVLITYGWSSAALAALLLRRVRHEWVHLALFAALGAAGGLGVVRYFSGFEGVIAAEPASYALFVVPGVATALGGRIGMRVWAKHLRHHAP